MKSCIFSCIILCRFNEHYYFLLIATSTSSVKYNNNNKKNINKYKMKKTTNKKYS